jgi:hypothetical protein
VANAAWLGEAELLVQRAQPQESQKDFINQPGLDAMMAVRKHLRWVANHKLKPTLMTELNQIAAGGRCNHVVVDDG